MIGQNRPVRYGERFWADLPHAGLYTGFLCLPMAMGGSLGARIDQNRSKRSGRASYLGLISGLACGAIIGAAGLAAYTALDVSH